MRKYITERNQKNKIEIALFVVGGVLLAVGLYLVLARWQGWSPFVSQASKVIDKNNASAKTINTSPKNNNVPDKSTPSSITKTTQASTQTTNEIPVSSAASSTITRLEQSNGTVYISTAIDNSSPGGTCVVTFTNPNDRPITKEFAPVSKDSILSCSISFPDYEFSYLGSWHTAARYYVNDIQTLAEGDITIK